MTRQTQRGRTGPFRRAFTLIEIMVTVVIIGIGLTAVMATIGSTTTVHDAGNKLTQAVFLAQEVREWTMGMDDFSTLDDATYSPPHNSQGEDLTGMTGWSQVLDVTWRSESDLATPVADRTSKVARVDLTVQYGTETVLTTSWLVTQKE